MKTLLVLAMWAAATALTLMWITGCTAVSYPTPNGTVSYTSAFTDRKLESLKLKLADGTTLELTEYTSETAKVAEAVARGVTQGMKP